MSSIAVGITVFNDPKRLVRVLEALFMFDGLWKGCLMESVPVRVFEDPWRPPIRREYASICRDYSVEFASLPSWGCMQGSFRFAVEHTPEDWFIYLPDDALPTPDCIGEVIEHIHEFDQSPIAAFQIPYWNADEMGEHAPWAGRKGDAPAKDFMWTEPVTWLRAVPLNPTWQRNGIFPIVNLNGAGFALRTASFRRVGGNSLETWCLDEDTSARLWFGGPYHENETVLPEGLIVATPGPPLVHYMGAAQVHPPHHFHCLDCWQRAGWPRDKDGVLHPRIRSIIKKVTGFERANEFDGASPWPSWYDEFKAAGFQAIERRGA